MIAKACEALEIEGLCWHSRFCWTVSSTSEHRRKIARFHQF
jgi:hypothetical protein